MEKSKKERKPRMVGETKNSISKKKGYYDYADIAREVMKDEYIINSGKDIDNIEKTVNRCCKSIGEYWGLTPLVEYIQSKIFLDRVVCIIIEIIKDNQIRKIINRINSQKDIKYDESKIINDVTIKVLTLNSSEKRAEQIKNDYSKKDVDFNRIIEIKDNMKKSFNNVYENYIDELLYDCFKQKSYSSGKAIQILEDTNNEVLELLNKKIDLIKYKNSLSKIISMIDLENFDKEIIKKEIQKIGDIYQIDTEKDIKETLNTLELVQNKPK